MGRVTVTLCIKGNPLDGNGRWKIEAGVGENQYVNLGAGAWGTQFSQEKDVANHSRKAARIMCFPATPAMQLAFPATDFENGSGRDAKQDALEELMADDAEMGIRMFIEWLQHHPDPVVREQMMRVILAKNPPPMFEGTS